MNLTAPITFISNAANYIANEINSSCCSKEKIAKIAQNAIKQAVTAAIQVGLLAAKFVVVPIEVAAIAVVVTLMTISLLASLPFHSNVAEAKDITIYHKLSSVCEDLVELTKITLLFGLVREEEEYRLADGLPNSPEYVVIRPDSPIRASAKPILYAPGYLDTPDSLREVCRTLANSHGGPVYIPKYRSLFQSIEEHAKDVARVAQRVLKDSNKNELILAGHSMGGLVTGCAVLNNHLQNFDIKLWVTVGTPFKGDPLAPIGYGDCARDMHINSDLIKRFNGPSRLDELPAVHIYSLADQIVPPEFATREGRPNAKIYVCKKPHGHLSMRGHNELMDVMLEATQKA